MANNNQKFKAGDIVQLKSSGSNSPKMTVSHYGQQSIRESIRGDENIVVRVVVWCQWFAGAKLQDGAFPEDSLDFASQ